MSLARSFLEIFLWAIIWFVLSFSYAALFGDHVWILIPILGTAYGFVAGIIYSVFAFLYRWRKENFSASIAMVTGLIASLLTTPMIIEIGVKLEAAMIFTVVSGAITGLVVNLLIEKRQKHAPAS